MMVLGNMLLLLLADSTPAAAGQAGSVLLADTSFAGIVIAGLQGPAGPGRGGAAGRPRPQVRDRAPPNVNHNNMHRPPPGGNRNNVNINRNVNVNVNDRYRGDYHGHYHDWDDDWDDHWHPMRTVATVAVTAAVVGSIVRSIPPNCSSVVVNNVSYSQCGNTWYQPQYVGSSVQYVVVNPPR